MTAPHSPKIHVIPPEGPFAPPRIPSIFILTPKGWTTVQSEQPHAVPPEEVHVVNQCFTLGNNATKGRYVQATT
eukprot:11297726-Ditylum_brightwellii.AAC.1